MRAGFAFVAAIVGLGLMRAAPDWGVAFLCAAVVLAAWRARVSPLRRTQIAFAAALIAIGALRGHPIEGALAAWIVVSAIELMRIF